MEDVAIVGVGQSAFSRKSGLSIQELCFEAYRDAIEGINVTINNVDASIICSTPEFDKQRLPSASISEYLGLPPRPTFYVESACSSGSMGVRVAYSLIKANLHKVIAVVGFQKMSELTSREALDRFSRSHDIMWESPFGLMMPAGYAMVARAHMARYGTTEEHLAKVRVKNSYYSIANPKAAYRKELSLKDALEAQVIASPLKMYDCCPNVDGSSCVIVARGDIAKDITDIPIWIMGLGAASDTMRLSSRKSLTTFRSATEAAKQAYEMAGIGPEDIDVAEVHDCFTIAEILAYEDLGFAKRGEGPKLIDEKQTYLGGKTPVNLDGGLLCKGHPIGATGGSQIRTIVRQLRGEAEAQVGDAEIGLVHNVGGVGNYSAITILRR